MTSKPTDSRAAAGRLLDALGVPDDLTHAEVQEHLQALVEAELAGVDVDAASEYTHLLRHLDHCEDCTALYAALAEDLAVLADPASTLPADRPSAPAFFPPARQDEHVILRIFGDVLRRFELALRAPQLAPTVATLGGGTRATLFTDTLAEINGSPLVSVALRAEGDLAELQVAIREAQATPHWQIQVAAGEIVRTAVTDDRGVAVFSDLPLAQLQQLTITCVELPTGDN
jgi:hypothetical protein